MNAFEQVLHIAQEQLAAVTRGDLVAAVNRLDERALLLTQSPAAQQRDTETIEEIMRLDRVLSDAIRERMIAIRDEALEGQRGQRALGGYAHTPSARAGLLDAVG